MIKYKPRLTAADMPENDNKYYIRKADGGYSPCIKGSPQHKHLTALSNCVGWVIGRAMEILQTQTNPLPHLNAEDFYNNTKLQKGKPPKNGSIICWKQGKLWNGGDGCGHVAVVEKVVSDNEIITSESAYGGMAFYTKRRNNNNGKWGASASYELMGFIYLPEECVPEDTTGDTPGGKPTERKVGDIVDFKGGYHYSSSNAFNSVGGKRTAGKAKITAIAATAKHKYHLIGEKGGSNVYGWVDAETVDSAAKPVTPTTPTLKAGDKVKVRQGAKTYKGGGLASFVYKQTYIVKQIGCGVAPDYVVIGTATAVTAAIRESDLIKV